MKGVKTNNGKKSTLSKILFRLRGYRGRLLITLLLSVAIVSLTLYVPILIGDAIDLITEPGRVDFKGILAIFGKVCKMCIRDSGEGVIGEKDGEKTLYKADTVITAMGMKPLRDEALALRQCAPEFYLTGDCRFPKSMREANWDAYQAALDIGRK